MSPRRGVSPVWAASSLIPLPLILGCRMLGIETLRGGGAQGRTLPACILQRASLRILREALDPWSAFARPSSNFPRPAACRHRHGLPRDASATFWSARFQRATLCVPRSVAHPRRQECLPYQFACPLCRPQAIAVARKTHFLKNILVPPGETAIFHQIKIVRTLFRRFRSVSSAASIHPRKTKPPPQPPPFHEIP